MSATTLGSSLSESELDGVVQKCSVESYRAGELVCCADEVLDRLFIITKGCLKGVAEANGKTLTRAYFNSGEVIGFYSLLFNEPAMIDLLAEFDTTVYSIGRADFLSLIEEFPGIRELLGSVFRKRFKATLSQKKLPRFARVIAFVESPTPTNITFEVASRLSKRGERVALFCNREFASLQGVQFAFSNAADFREQLSSLATSEFDRVIVSLGDENLPEVLAFFEIANEVIWSFSIAQSHTIKQAVGELFERSPVNARKIRRILLLPPGERLAPTDSSDERLHRRDFIMPAKPDDGSRPLYEQGIDRITRHLCDIKLGLALAGGGARGLVHFGVLRALDRAGISFDMMSGTSAGAMFGLSYAAGLDIDFLIKTYHDELTPGWPFNWLPNGDRWYLLWKFRSRGWDQMLRKYLDCNFEQLQIPFYTMAVDLIRGREVVCESGDIIHAMLESLNLPGIAKPIFRDGQALVDGGVLNNLPASVLVEKGADFVVGVNVSSELKQEYGINRPDMKPSEMKSAGNLETFLRIIEVMGKGSSASQRSAVDLLINPDTSEFSFTDFTNGYALSEAGEATAEKFINLLKKRIGELMVFKPTI